MKKAFRKIKPNVLSLERVKHKEKENYEYEDLSNWLQINKVHHHNQRISLEEIKSLGSSFEKSKKKNHNEMNI